MKLFIFYFISHKYRSSSFPSLEECYTTFDDIRLPRCKGAQIEEEGNVHICAVSDAGRLYFLIITSLSINNHQLVMMTKKMTIKTGNKTKLTSNDDK